MRISALFLSLILAFAAFAAEETTTTPAAAATTAKRFGTWGFDVEGMDRSVKPGDDFFKYANGKWAASTQIPPDRVSYGASVSLIELSEARVRAILDGLAASNGLKAGSDEAKLAALYRTFLDEATLEKIDAKPLQSQLDEARKAKTHTDVAELLGRALANFGKTYFDAQVSDDAKNPDKYALYLSQGSLGLPDRDYYLKDNFKAQKERYQQYVADMLRMAGWDDPDKSAADIVAFETKVAEVQWSRAESRDRDKTYNPTTPAELEKNAPGFPWSAYFKGAGLAKLERAVVMEKTAFPKLAKIYADTPVETLKAWYAFTVTDQAAPYLSKRFVDANWEFRSKFLSGAREQRPRWKRAVAAAAGGMGEALGRKYVAEYFPPESKAKMEKLVADLRTAMKMRIQKLDWMSPETKTRAVEKLAKFGVKIGYPKHWRDYSKLDVQEGDLAGNVRRQTRFQWDFVSNRVGKAVDKDEWELTPQTVNAYYTSEKNEIVFPAAILQPPFFDPNADPAVNYGGIGAVIGHEITHGFDDQGRKSDGDGVLRDWWSADDAKKFEAQAARLGAQYEALKFPQFTDIHIIGQQTMGENIGDLGGVLLALEAYKVSLHGQPGPVLDGFTGEQRVFLGWAQVWRTMMRDAALKQYITTNEHSPGMVRAFAPLRNVDAWYDAFGVKEGDPLYVKPEDRVRIW
jgi:putative endopeptidase